MNLFDKITGVKSRIIPGKNYTDTFGSASSFLGNENKSSIIPKTYSQQAPMQFGVPTQPIQQPVNQQENPVVAQLKSKGYDDKDIEFLKQAKAKGISSQQAFSYLDKKKKEQKQGPDLGVFGSIGQAGIGAVRTGEQIPRYAGNLLNLTQKYITTPVISGGAEMLGATDFADKWRRAGSKFGEGAKALGEEITRAGEGDITEKQREARRFGASMVATAPIPLGTASKVLQGAGLAKTAVRGAIAGGIGTPIYTGLEEGRLPTAPEMVGGTIGGAILGPAIEKVAIPAVGKAIDSVQRFINPVKFTKQMDDETISLIRQAVRPSVSGVDTAGKFDMQDKKLLQGVKEIMWQGKKPTNSRELMTAIKETKDSLWNKVKEANASVTAETSGDDIALKLRQFINDPENRTTFLSRPELKGNLMKMADEIQSNPDFKNITQDELQQVLSDVNSRIPASSFLKQLDANPTQTAQNTIIAKVYKEILDDNLERAVGVAGNEARQAYGSVRQLEKDFAKRFGVYLRQNPKGLADMFGMEGFADVAVGLLSGNPAQFARGALIQGAKNLLKKSNSPDTIINDIFSLQGKIKGVKPQPIKKAFTSSSVKKTDRPIIKTKAEEVLKESQDLAKRAKEIKYLKEDIASNTKSAQFGGTGEMRIKTAIDSAVAQGKITIDEAKTIVEEILDSVNAGERKYQFTSKKGLESLLEEMYSTKYNPAGEFDKLVTSKTIKDPTKTTVNLQQSKGGFIKIPEIGKKIPVKNPLVEEARKYKSAEEFVKAKENSGDIVYHGTKTNFDSFSKEKLGLNTGASSAKEGFFFTDSKQNANHYTKTDINADAIIGKIAKNDNLLLSTNYGVKRFGYTNPIDALYSGGKKELTKSEILKKVSEDFDIEINKSIGEVSMYPKFLQKGILDKLDSIKNSKKELLDLWEKGLEDNTKVGANIKKVLLKYKKPFVTTENHVNKSGGQFTKLTGDNGEKFTSYTDAIKYAKENGYDAVRINGANDPLPGNTVVVFNENQILTESQLRKIYEESKK